MAEKVPRFTSISINQVPVLFEDEVDLWMIRGFHRLFLFLSPLRAGEGPPVLSNLPSGCCLLLDSERWRERPQVFLCVCLTACTHFQFLPWFQRVRLFEGPSHWMTEKKKKLKNDEQTVGRGPNAARWAPHSGLPNSLNLQTQVQLSRNHIPSDLYPRPRL